MRVHPTVYVVTQAHSTLTISDHVPKKKNNVISCRYRKKVLAEGTFALCTFFAQGSVCESSEFNQACDNSMSSKPSV